jgi:hypothetical protein
VERRERRGIIRKRDSNHREEQEKQENGSDGLSGLKDIGTTPYVRHET